MKESSGGKGKGILIIFSLAIIVVSYFILQRMSAKPTTPPDDVMVLTAPKDLPEGSKIVVDQLEWTQYPPDKIEPTFIRKNQADEIVSLAGAIVRVPILKGTPIKAAYIIKTGDKSALSIVIQPGKRAVPIPLSKFVNAPTLIAPGDIVDIIIPKLVPDSGTGKEASYYGQTMLRGIRVLAVDKALQKTELTDVKGSGHTITLEVDSQQAESLAAAIRDGQIIISLRSVYAEKELPLLQQPIFQPQEEEESEEEKDEEKQEQAPTPEKGKKVVKVVRGVTKK